MDLASLSLSLESRSPLVVFSSNPSLSCSCSSFPSTSSTRTIKRRGGITCKKPLPRDTNDEDSMKSTQKKKISRRNAITSYSRKLPRRYIRSLREKFEFSDSEDDSVQYITAVPPSKRTIVFDENNNYSGKYKDNKKFLHSMCIHFKEMYSISSNEESETFQSIVRNLVLEEMKSQGLSFVKKSFINPGKIHIMDDVFVLQKIQEALDIELSSPTKNQKYAHSA
mmetsp:Transcript_18106/g.22167  ORF Transcript_18106/g.22167 Transcript_18106/m.22167 type:complete len:224 (+) Transcript_18106:73-744(+)